MLKNFLSLEPTKRSRIRNAALHEFGRYGYKKTSTEQIARGASIAKGMIFHYFGNKLGLYEYLFDYCARYLEGLYGNIEAELLGLDFIEQFRVITKRKLQVYIDEPNIFEFITMAYLQPENLEVSEKTIASCQRIRLLRLNSLRIVNSSGSSGEFRADIGADMAKKYVNWLIDGYSQELIVRFGNSSLADVEVLPWWDEFDRVLDDLKKLFYKGE